MKNEPLQLLSVKMLILTGVLNILQQHITDITREGPPYCRPTLHFCPINRTKTDVQTSMKMNT